MALPAASAVTLPLLSTETIYGADDSNVTFLFAAVDGKTFHERVNESPICAKVYFSGERVTPVTATFCGISTVTLNSPLTPPFIAVTSIFAVPFATEVILPFSSTVATFGFVELKITLLFVAFFGKIEYFTL